MEERYLIVGLGNPGKEYARTRHNAGFLLAERLAGAWQASWAEEKRFFCRLAPFARSDRRGWLCLPQTYMNESGKAVGGLVQFYRIGLDRLLILVDDADLCLGTIRLRPGGSTGGHHGLASIEERLGSRRFARLRIGIGRQPGSSRRLTGHVLGRFGQDELQWLERTLDRATRQVECWLASGPEKAMNLYNGSLPAPDPEGSA